MDKKKPKLKLVGTDGNAFAVLGKAQAALKSAGYTKAQLDVFLEDAMSGDYNHLLATVMQHCEVS